MLKIKILQLVGTGRRRKTNELQAAPGNFTLFRTTNKCQVKSEKN